MPPYRMRAIMHCMLSMLYPTMFSTEEECYVEVNCEIAFQRGYSYSKFIAEIRWKKDGELNVNLRKGETDISLYRNIERS